MSEPENSPPKSPTVKTSAVPLKKETVRITLRPSAPPSEPLAPVAPPPPTAQVPTPSAPAAPPRPPTIGAPTVPLRAAPAPSPVGGPRPTGPLAPPPPVRPSGGAPVPPAAPVGSKTIPLQQAPARPTTPVGRPTTGLAGAPATQPLPKATVKLQKTQPVAGGPPTASVSTAQIRTATTVDDDDDVDREAGLQGLSIVALIGGIAALLIAFMSWQGAKPFAHKPVVDSTDEAAWKQGGTNDWKLPAEHNPYAKKVGDSWVSTFKEKLPVIPERTAQ